MVDVVVVDEAGDGLVQELWPLYRRVFGDFDDADAWRDQVWDRHASRAGSRMALARDGGELVGFAYGYTGETGQWWTDNAATVLHPEVASDWLGGHFELVSIGGPRRPRTAPLSVGGVGRHRTRALPREGHHGPGVAAAPGVTIGGPGGQGPSRGAAEPIAGESLATRRDRGGRRTISGPSLG